MTAHAMQEERERCLAAGMNEHLSKPVVIENLYDMLARLTGRTAKTSSEPVIKDELEHQSILITEYLPGINIETALSRINGNKRLLGQLIKIFAQDHQGITQEVRHFIADNDTLSAARLVHGLKGVAGNLSAERLQIASANLETALKNKDINASSALLPLLEAALAEVFTAATLLTETATPARTTGTFSSKEISSLLGELQNLLEIHSLDLSSPLDSLRAMLTQGDEHNQIEALAESVQRLDYQKALIILQSLAEKISGNEEQL
jgi:HPt (histidine-containing phosphotransfer) domain-containing protein